MNKFFLSANGQFRWHNDKLCRVVKEGKIFTSSFHFNDIVA